MFNLLLKFFVALKRAVVVYGLQSRKSKDICFLFDLLG